MVTVIYIDVLLFVNIVVDYFLLRITAFFTGVPKRQGRIALAAFVGSLFSLVVLLPHLHIIWALLIKAVGALAMALIAFGAKSLRGVLRNLAYLFVASSLLAGVVIAANEFLHNSAFLSKNMGIYIDISPLTLIIIVLILYLSLCLFELLFKKHRRQDISYRATLQMGGRQLSFAAILDSGNKLYDAMTGRDAVILKESLSAKLLSETQSRALAQSAAGNNAAQYLSEIGDFALLPFRSVGGEGLLLGFGAQRCEVELENGRKVTIEKPFVAFAADTMLGETEGIIGSDAVEV